MVMVHMEKLVKDYGAYGMDGIFHTEITGFMLMGSLTIFYKQCSDIKEMH